MATISTGWYCRHEASVTSQTDTTATITVKCYWQNDGWRYDINFVSAWVYCNGVEKQVMTSGSVDNADSVKGSFLCGSATFTINKSTSQQSINCYAKIQSKSSYVQGTKSSTASAVSVAAKTKYTVSYNANGGSGAPSAQTKWYGTNLTLSSTKPTRTGYTFAGWATSASGAVAYQSGATYSANAAVTLYAKWTAITYTISYNANGGTGAPASQTKTHGTDLTLSSTKPTRANYSFKGWATSKSATSAAYSAGGKYTANASVTLYAVWSLTYVPPRITEVNIYRCNSSGTADDSGTYFKATFKWATDKTATSIRITYVPVSGGTEQSAYTTTPSGTSGTVTTGALGGGNLDANTSYKVTIYVKDTQESFTFQTLSGGKFPIDTAYNTDTGEIGVSIGKPVEKFNCFDVGLDSEFRGTNVYHGNHYCFSTPGVAGQTGYIRMARLTHKKANADTPITFVFTRRLAPTPMTVHVQFKSDSTTVDPGVESITYEGSNYGAFLVKFTTSVWDLYVQKVSAYDTITLQDWYSSRTVADRLSVTFPGDLSATLTEGVEGFYRATPARLRNIMDFVMPVGFILHLYSHADPNTMYPGTTWVRISNAFLWGCDASGTIGQTGGEKTHTLTVDELPAHSHGSVYSQHADGTKNAAWYTTAGSSIAYGPVETGGGEAHNNMPPYVQVSIWRRTA